MKSPEEIILEMNWSYDSDPARFQMWEQLIKPAMLNYHHQQRTVAVKHFQYADKAVEFINKEKVKVVSICSSDKFGEGCHVFYEVV
ncbi:MAG: hypothetical protein RLZZ605_679 [Bacteroidota bacterium]|jgi:hypothetical protein